MIAGDPDVVIDNSVSAMTAIGVAEDARGTDDVNAGSVQRNDDHAVAPMLLAVRVRKTHNNGNLAGRTHGAT